LSLGLGGRISNSPTTSQAPTVVGNFRSCPINYEKIIKLKNRREMTFDKRHKNIILSLLLFTVLCLLVFNIQWDTDFAGAGLTFATDIVAIGIGLLFILLKIFRVTISKTNFIYTYFGVLNLILGLLTFGIIIFYKSFTIGIISLPLIQLLIALFILTDIFKRKKRLYKSTH